MYHRPGIKIWTHHSFVLLQFMRLTNGQTDRQTDRWTHEILIARPRLHFMQRGKIPNLSRCRHDAF